MACQLGSLIHLSRLRPSNGYKNVLLGLFLGRGWVRCPTPIDLSPSTGRLCQFVVIFLFCILSLSVSLTLFTAMWQTSFLSTIDILMFSPSNTCMLEPMLCTYLLLIFFPDFGLVCQKTFVIHYCSCPSTAFSNHLDFLSVNLMNLLNSSFSPITCAIF